MNNIKAIKTNKILIAYFSHSGNTEIIAKDIQQETGGDLFEIEPVNEYPQNYQRVVDQAKIEIRNGYLPELKSKINNLDEYDVIFIGSPNWWSTVAPPVATFLSSNNFNGKKIVPFYTHGGGGKGHFLEDIKKICKNSVLLDELVLYGNSNVSSAKEISQWLDKIGIVKK